MNKTVLKDVDHCLIYKETIDKNPIFSMPTDNIQPVFKFDRKFEISIPLKEDWINGTLPSEHGITIYTDGSLNEAAGAGIVCYDPTFERSIPLGKYSSIYLAEIRAILESVDIASEMNITNKTIFICTDSQAILKALASPIFTSATTLDTWEALNKIALSNKVNLLWVPSHSGIKGNEKADELAKNGAKSSLRGPEPSMSIPFSYHKLKITNLLEEASYNHWTNTPNCRQAKNCIRINKKNSKFLINLSRTRLKIYTGVMTGHYGFNKHLTTIGKRNDPSCELCGFHTDTAEHYLCHCPAYCTGRRKHLGSFTVRYHQIKYLHPQNILNYIASTNRFE